MNNAQALREGARQLAPVSDTARLDAELLLAHALGVSRSELLLRRMDEPVPGSFAALLARRARAEPVAYILECQEFYGQKLSVNPAVLIPRADSETLIEAARAALAPRPPRRILDLGTGSGALLIAALWLWPQALGVGVDRSPEALAVAQRNASACVPASEARFERRDWRAPGWAQGLGRFDLLLCNPPYVEEAAQLAPQVRDYEPAGALFAGADGLADYRILIPHIAALLAPGGLGVLEIGADQAAAVGALAAAAGLEAALRRDLAGRPRALMVWEAIAR